MLPLSSTKNVKQSCYCDSGKTFDQCCQPFLLAKAKPATPVQLMRSRFSAFCLEEHKYLLASLYPQQRSANDEQQLIESCQQTQWVKLKVTKQWSNKETSNVAYVSFIATFEESGEYFELRESSTFIKQEQSWYYSHGDSDIKAVTLKWPRNSPCWCRSTKKYKHCHAP